MSQSFSDHLDSHYHHFGHTRRSLLLTTSVLVALFLLTCAILIYTALQQNLQAEKQSQTLASRALDGRQDALGILLAEHAFWGEAYQHLHLEQDWAWAYEAQNFGPSFFWDFGYEGLFVVNNHNQTVYSVINGQLQSAEVQQWLRQDITPILEQARRQGWIEETVSTFLSKEGQLVVLAAAALMPSGNPHVHPDERLASVVIMVDVLTPQELAEMGSLFGLHRLRVIPSQETNHQTLPNSYFWVSLASGEVVSLSWEQDPPGDLLLHYVLPLILALGLIFALLIRLALDRMLYATQALQENTHALLQSQVALHHSETRFRDVAEASSDWIWEVNSQLEICYLSERFGDITGLSLENWQGRSLEQLFSHKNKTETLHQQLQRVAHNPQASLSQLTYLNAEGEQRICQLAFCQIRDDQHACLGFRGTARDITNEATTRAHIEHLSRHDTLTQLPNRAYMQEFLSRSLTQMVNQTQHLHLLCLDLDRFKQVNDTLGHAAGDEVLCTVSQRLKSLLSKQDLVCRQGGDEFILILGGQYAFGEIESLCSRLIQSIEQPIQIGTHEVFISTSIGVASAPLDAEQADELLRCGDIALYEAKGAGRQRWSYYTQELGEQLLARRQLETDLRTTLTTSPHTLHLVFQPRFLLDTGQLVAAEALLRWQHPLQGLLTPDRFIAMAEDVGLIQSLSDWVLREACHQAASWPDSIRISVNLSPLDLHHSQLPERLQQVLEESGLSPQRLELEIPERAMVDNSQTALGTLQRLKQLGVQLVMDDFGTGYSSLSHLRTLPLDGFKIDRSFLNDLEASNEGQAIIWAIVELGQALHMRITAEGVQSQEQLEILRQTSCHEAQGFYLAYPQSSSDFQALLSQEKLKKQPL